MAKYYFINRDDEYCADIESVKDFMRFNEMKEIEVFEAKRDLGSDFLFCKFYWAAGEKGICGNVCEKYDPRNGKNGICIYNAPVYERGNKIKIKLKPLN